MSDAALVVENLSKLYRLGEVGTGSLAQDVNRWWHRIRGLEDPYLKVGQVNDRTKKHASPWVWALNQVGFELKRGEVLGIIGRNGAGKSTLLKILSRVTAPSKGTVKLNGRIASLLEVGTGFHPELTGRENIFLNGSILGMRKAEISKHLDEIVSFSGCGRYLDTPVRRYSSGMYVRLAFAVAAHLQASTLIIDEVLAVGDAEFQKKCVGRMKEVATNEGRSVIFVSHNMGAVATLCDRAIVLDNGEIKFTGKVEEAITKYLDLGDAHNTGFERRPEDISTFVQPTILSAQILNHLDEPATHLDFRSPFSLHLEYHCPQPLTGLEISYRIFHASGVPVLTSNLSDCHASSLSVERKGSFVAKANMPAATLMPGRYFLNIALHEPNVALHDFKENILQFEIMETGSIGAKHGQGALEMGFVHLKINWDESPADGIQLNHLPSLTKVAGGMPQEHRK